MSVILNSPWRNFSYAELACQCGACESDGTEMDVEHMHDVQLLRDDFGASLPINSAVRCPRHPIEAKKTTKGTHAMYVATDIQASHLKAFNLLMKIMAGVDSGRYRFTGIGIHQRGPMTGRFIHVDSAPSAPGRPRPHIWTY